MKFLLSPVGLILIVVILAIVFFPRRAPDAVKKRLGRPMRAFPDEDHAQTPADGSGTPGAASTGSSATSRATQTDDSSRSKDA